MVTLCAPCLPVPELLLNRTILLANGSLLVNRAILQTILPANDSRFNNFLMIMWLCGCSVGGGDSVMAETSLGNVFATAISLPLKWCTLTPATSIPARQLSWLLSYGKESQKDVEDLPWRTNMRRH